MGQKIWYERKWAIELAKIKLHKMLTDPMLRDAKISAHLAIKILVLDGLTKNEVKTARKELGIISKKSNGIQYWFLPGKDDSDA